MISFNRPLLLILIFLVPLFYYLRRTRILRQIEFPLTLGDWNGLPFKWSSPVMSSVSFISRVAAIAGFACLVAALAGPVRYRPEHLYSDSGNAIIFVLDISPSMAARDLGSETRLDSARQFIHAFSDQRPGDSFGLAALGSEAALLVPPTTDHAVFLSRLDSLRIGEMGEGTALGLGLAVAAAHLMQRGQQHPCVIMFTDGENNTGEINPKTAASVCAENNIRLFIVGIGSRGEVPIEYTDPATGKQYSGVLNSEYDETALRDIAAKGNGLYIPAGSREALDSVFAAIGVSVPSSHPSYTRTIEEPLEKPVILAALALFALVWFLKRLVMGAVL